MEHLVEQQPIDAAPDPAQLEWRGPPQLGDGMDGRRTENPRSTALLNLRTRSSPGILRRELKWVYPGL
jgi:hypothetical protein